MWWTAVRIMKEATLFQASRTSIFSFDEIEAEIISSFIKRRFTTRHLTLKAKRFPSNYPNVPITSAVFYLMNPSGQFHVNRTESPPSFLPLVGDLSRDAFRLQPINITSSAVRERRKQAGRRTMNASTRLILRPYKRLAEH